MKKVTVIDYGIGNLFSVKSAFEFCGFEVEFAATPESLTNAQHLVLPGVGAFEDGMRELKARNLVGAIQDHCKIGKPLLGICLGMQMLFEVGEEFGTHSGLGILSGKVVKIPETSAQGSQHKIPHIGWNSLVPKAGSTFKEGFVFKDVPSGSAVYFVHSYHVQPHHPEDLLAVVDYNGRSISAVVGRGAVMGCQFHPEKSGEIGLTILRNFMGTGV